MIGDVSREWRIRRERRWARELMETLARRNAGLVQLVEPDNDDPPGTPPELLATALDGQQFVLTIEPAEGWEL